VVSIPFEPKVVVADESGFVDDTDESVETETVVEAEGTVELAGVELAWPPPHAVRVNPMATSKPLVVCVLNMHS
jgi:hypothetical protein